MTGDAYPHGTLSRYNWGRCRCAACRRAIREYRRRARGPERAAGNGFIDAAPVRRHLADLSRQGVGFRSAADAASVSRTTAYRVVTGEHKRIRATSAAALLAVDAGAVADGAVIDAASTWRDVDWLVHHGLTRGDIAVRIGNRTAELNLGRRRVLASTALRIAKLRRAVEDGRETATVEQVCTSCGYSHSPARRQRAIAPLVADGVKPRDIAEAWPCFYPWAGERLGGGAKVYRDIHRCRRASSAEADRRAV